MTAIDQGQLSLIQERMKALAGYGGGPVPARPAAAAAPTDGGGDGLSLIRERMLSLSGVAEPQMDQLAMDAAGPGMTPYMHVTGTEPAGTGMGAAYGMGNRDAALSLVGDTARLAQAGLAAGRRPLSAGAAAITQAVRGPAMMQRFMGQAVQRLPGAMGDTTGQRMIDAAEAGVATAEGWQDRARGVQALPSVPGMPFSPGVEAAAGQVADITKGVQRAVQMTDPEDVRKPYSPQWFAYNIGRTLPGMIASIGGGIAGAAAAGPPGAYLGAMGPSALLEAGTQATELYNDGKANGLSDEDALAEAFLPSVQTGLGVGAVESMAGPEAAVAVKGAMRTARAFARSVLKQAAGEAVTEPVQGAMSEGIARQATGGAGAPGFWDRRAQEAVLGGTLGAVAGGPVAAGQAMRGPGGASPAQVGRKSGASPAQGTPFTEPQGPIPEGGAVEVLDERLPDGFDQNLPPLDDVAGRINAFRAGTEPKADRMAALLRLESQIARAKEELSNGRSAPVRPTGTGAPAVAADLGGAGRSGVVAEPQREQPGGVAGGESEGGGAGGGRSGAADRAGGAAAEGAGGVDVEHSRAAVETIVTRIEMQSSSRSRTSVDNAAGMYSDLSSHLKALHDLGALTDRELRTSAKVMDKQAIIKAIGVPVYGMHTRPTLVPRTLLQEETDRSIASTLSASEVKRSPVFQAYRRAGRSESEAKQIVFGLLLGEAKRGPDEVAAAEGAAQGGVKPWGVGEDVYYSGDGGTSASRVVETKMMFGVQKVKLLNGSKWFNGNDPRLSRDDPRGKPAPERHVVRTDESRAAPAVPVSPQMQQDLAQEPMGEQVHRKSLEEHLRDVEKYPPSVRPTRDEAVAYHREQVALAVKYGWPTSTPPQPAPPPQAPPNPAPAAGLERNPNVPDWVNEGLIREGKNPMRMLNEYDAARPDTIKALEKDPIAAFLKANEPALHARLLKGDLSQREYMDALARSKSAPATPKVASATPDVASPDLSTLTRIPLLKLAREIGVSTGGKVTNDVLRERIAAARAATPPAPAKAAEAATAARQPWEMTREEWSRKGFDPAYPRLEGQKPMQDGEHQREQWAAVHERGVMRAVDEGRPVPARVLADYPDLAKPSPAAAPSAPPATPEGRAEDAQTQQPRAREAQPAADSRGQVGQAGEGTAKAAKPKTFPPDLVKFAEEAGSYKAAEARAAGMIEGIDKAIAQNLSNRERVLANKPKKPGEAMDEWQRNNSRHEVAVRDENNKLAEQKKKIERQLKQVKAYFEAKTPTTPASTTDKIIAATERAEAAAKERIKKRSVTVPKRKQPVSTKEAAGLTDVGEKIGGARKDQWAKRGLTKDDLAAMTDREAFQHVTKQAVMPTPNWAEMVEGGMEPTVARTLKAMYDGISAKPADSPKARELYVEALGIVRDEFAKVQTMDDAKALSKRIAERFGRPSGMGPDASEWFRSDMGRAYSSLFRTRTSPFAVTYTVERRVKDDIANGWPKKAEAADGPWYKIVSRSDGSAHFIARIKTGKLADKTAFKTAAEAEEYAKTHFNAAGAKRGSKVTVEPLEGISRTIPADYREGRDISADEFRDTFQFRGVEFGNWTDEGDRQQGLNHAYDALMDFAAVLGVEPGAISLGGKLAAAFGARGSGFGSAHYESGRQVINLTRTRGAGAFAHEWAHAIDDYFGRTINRPNSAPFVSDSQGRLAAMSGLRPEIAQAYAEVMAAIRSRSETDAEVLDRTRKQIEHTEKQAKAWMESTIHNASMTPEARERYKARVDEATRSFDGEAINAAARAHKEETGRKWSSDVEKGVLLNYEARKRATERLARMMDKGVQPDDARKVRTEYLKVSEETGDYWARDHELFARAFETFMLDQLHGRSDYLVNPNIQAAEQWPRGAERASMSAAFGKFVDSLRVREIDTKTGETVSEGANTRLTSTLDERLKRMEDAARNRLRKRMKDRATTFYSGVDPTIVADIIDAGIVVAMRAIRTGAKTLRGVSKATRAVIDELYPHLKDSFADVRRVARKVVTDARDADGNFADEARIEQAVADAQERAESTEPVTVNRRFIDEATGVRKVEPKTLTKAQALVAGLRRQSSAAKKAWRQGRSEARKEANLRLREVIADKNATAAERRAEVIEILNTIPATKITRRIGKLIANATTPGRVDRLARALLRYSLKQSAREYSARIRRTSNAKTLRTLSTDRAAEVQQLARAGADKIDALNRAADNDPTPSEVAAAFLALEELEEITRGIAEHIADQRAESSAFKADKLRTRAQHVKAEIANIEAQGRASKRARKGKPDADPRTNLLAVAWRAFGNVRNTAMHIAGRGSILRRLVYDRMVDAENNHFSQKRDDFEYIDRIAKRAGFKGLADLAHKSSGTLGDSARVQVKVTLGGKEQSIWLGDALALAATATDPQTMRQLARGRSFNLAGNATADPIVASRTELETLVEKMKADYPGLIFYAKELISSRYPAARESAFRLNGWRPDKHAGYWMRHVNTKQSDKAGLPSGWRNIARRYMENAGFTKDRDPDARVPLLVKDFLGDLVGHLDSLSNLTHMAEPVRNAESVLAHPELRKAIVDRHGAWVYRQMERHMAHASLANAPHIGSFTRASREVAGNVAVSSLATSVPSMATQIGGVLRLVHELGPERWATGIANIGTVTKGELEKANGYAWNRWHGGGLGQFTPLASEALDYDDNSIVDGFRAIGTAAAAGDIKGAYNAWRETGRKAMGGYNYMDSLAFRIATAGILPDVQKAHPDWTRDRAVKHAAHRAEMMIRHSQNASSVQDRPPIINEAHSTPGALFFQFMSDLVVAHNRLRDAQGQGAAKFVSAAATEAANILWSRGTKWGWRLALIAAFSALGGEDDETRRLALRNAARIDDDRWRAASDVANTLLPMSGKAIEGIAAAFGKAPRSSVADVPVVRTLDKLKDNLADMAAGTYEAATGDREEAAKRLMRSIGRISDDASGFFLGDPTAPLRRQSMAAMRELEDDRRMLEHARAELRRVGQGNSKAARHLSELAKRYRETGTPAAKAAMSRAANKVLDWAKNKPDAPAR